MVEIPAHTAISPRTPRKTEGYIKAVDTSLRGRFTPVGFLLEKVFSFFDFFVLFDFLSESCAKLGLILL